MSELVSLTLLEEALSPVPRDFETLCFSKTYEREVGGKIHVGFIVYVHLADEKWEESCSVLRDDGYCIFTLGNDYHDDYISEKEEIIAIDDNRLPESVRDKWVSLMVGIYESYNLEDLYYVLNQKKLCSSLRGVIMSIMEKLKDE